MDLITILPVVTKDLPISPRFTTYDFYRDASSALLQLVSQWLNFTYSRSHAFRHERKNTISTLVRIELTTSTLAGVCAGYLLDHSGDDNNISVQHKGVAPVAQLVTSQPSVVGR